LADLQSSLNAHLTGLGAHERLEIDGEWGPKTDLAFERVCRILGVAPERRVRTFRIVVGATQRRTPEELARAESDGAAYAKRLRHHFTTVPAAPPATANGARYMTEIVHAARRHRVPLALACAVVEKETGFRNVYGHDPVRNPIKSPPGGLLAVTRDNYREYLAHRRRGLGNQGVGPMRLTSSGLQDRAEALGGCWRVGPNIRSGSSSSPATSAASASRPSRPGRSTSRRRRRSKASASPCAGAGAWRAARGRRRSASGPRR
jgi:hypothetical protein